MSQEKIRVGVIGAGWWAANTHIPALRAIAGVEIAAACRRDPVRMKEFADVVGVKSVYLNHEEMLDREKLDAVIVCSPHSLHYSHVKSVLERRIPVLTDKPLSIRSSEARELVELAEAQGTLLAVFFGHAYDSHHRYIAREIREGNIGRVAHIASAYFANPDSLGFFGNFEFQPNPDEFPILPTQFRADPELGGGGYLQDVGNHALSAMLIGTGMEVAEVSAMMDSSEIDLRATVSLKFTDGAMGTVTIAADLRPRVKGYFGYGNFHVTGDTGGFWKHGGDSHLWRQEWGGAPETISEERLPAGTNPDANFIAAIRGEAELIAPGVEALKCVQAIEAAYLSAKSGAVVKLK